MLNQSSTSYSAYDSHYGHDKAAQIYIWVVFAVLCQAVSLLGILTNIVNIVCFVHQGFKDPVNISLLGLAVSDMCSLISLSWLNVCYTPSISQADLPFDAREISYLTAGIPHLAFSRVTSWITAVITLERCVCVSFPLKVKQLITSRRMAGIIIFMFIILLSCEAPIFAVTGLHMKFVPTRNKTILGIFSSADKHQVETISFAINNSFLPLAAFVVIITCTGILVVNLQTQTKWRTSQTAARNPNVVKMVIMISALFCSCFTPMIIFALAVAIEPEFNGGGKAEYMSIYTGGVGFLLEAINSASNIFIYYSMSTKYRKTFKTIFRKYAQLKLNELT